MRKIYALLFTVALFVSASVNGQSVANYTPTRTTGITYSSISGTGTSSSGWRNALSTDDNLSVTLPIGFTFVYNGTPYTQFSLSTNGYLTFNTGTAATGSGTGAYGYQNTTFSDATGTFAVLAPFYDDQQTAGNLGTLADLNATYKYLTTGSAGSRVLTVEWINSQDFSSTSTASFNYQVKLYEADGHIEFIYSTMTLANTSTLTTMSYSLGINAATVSAVPTTAQLLTLQTVNTNTFNNTASNALGGATPANMPATNSMYSFTPPVATAAPTGLNFTSINALGMTLNWTDVSASETGYAVYRSDDGGTTYNLITQLAANAITSIQTGLTPSTTYFWKVYAINEGNLSTALSGSQATAAAGNISSTGAGGNWSSTATWAGGVVPTISDNVTIVDGATVTVDVTTAVAYTVTVGTGGAAAILQYDGTTTAKTLTVGNNVTINANGTVRSNTASPASVTNHVLTLAGNMAINGAGTFNGSASVNSKLNITFTGATNNTFTTSATSTTSINTVTINKGTNNVSILDFTPGVNWTATAGSQGFAITNGTLKISGSATIANVVFNAIGYSIPSTGGFWLNNSNFTVSGQASSPTMSGLLRMTAGTFNVGTASGNAMSGATTSSFIIEGGTMNFSGRLNVTSSGASFNMSAGTINITTVGNSSSATAGFGFTSTTSVFTMSGGTINLVNRNTGATILDYNVATTSPTITGGTLNIGTAATATNFNFGIQGAMPNVVVDNTTNNKTANLTAAARVYGNLTINTGATFSGVASTITMFGNPTNIGNVINNGTITNTSGGGTNRFQFSGTYGAQNYSGAGVFGTAALPYSGLNLDNASGVTFSNPVIATRANLFQGTYAGSNITLGGTTNVPFIQIGGTATVNAGSFSSSPTFDITAGLPGILYSTALSAVTTAFEIPATRNIGSLTINNTNGVTLASGALNLIGATPVLTMTLGNFNLGTNNLTLGVSAAIPGTLTYTAGFITTSTGTFTRWYPTTGLPIAAGTSIGYYPFATSGNNRQVQLFFSSATALSAGGTITIGHDNTSGTTAITGFTDGAITIDKRTNANWPITTGGGITLTGGQTISAAVRGDNMAAVADYLQLRLIRATDAVGTYAATTGSNASPVLNRTGLDLTMLASTFYMGSPSANLGLTYTAITNGNWGDNGTWDLAGSPSASDNAIIPSPYNVTLAGATTPYQCINLTINSGGTLTANANTLDIGTSGGGNKALTVNGTLAIGGGTINHNGNVVINSGGTLSMSSGNLVIDGNDGTTNGSVATGTSILHFNSNTLNLTGGTITIVDPHRGVASTDYALSYNNASSVNIASSGTTFKFGNGASAQAGGNANGFYNHILAGAGRLSFGNVIVDAVSRYNNRFVNFQTQTGIVNLTITSGEYRISSGFTNNISGNITNNGTMAVVNTGVLSLSNYLSGTTTATTTAQTISGSGAFTNGVPTIALGVAGTGYVAGDVLTLTGGTFTTAATVTVISVNAGVITSVALTNQGIYTVAPTSPLAYTGGTGTTATITCASPSAFIRTADIGALTVNNTNATGVTLSTGTNLVLGSALTLTAGIVNTNSTNVLTLSTGVTTPPNGSATSYINGPLAIQVNTGTNTSRTFAIGQGLNWRPVALVNFHSNTTLQTYTAEIINGATGGSPVLPLINLNTTRYFRIQNTTNIGSTTIATVQLSYGGDDGSTSPLATARVAQANTAAGSYNSRGGTSAASPTTGILSSTGLTLGDEYFVIANEDLPPITWDGGAATNNWEDALNWSGDVVPVSTDNVSLSGAGAITINLNTARAVNDLTIGTNATLNLNSNTLTVNRDYTQTAGVINLNTGTLDVKRNFAKSGGTYTPSTGTTSLTGTAGQTFSSTGGITLYNFSLSGAGGDKTFTVSQTITVNNDLTVASTASMGLTAATATTHNVAGNLVYSSTTGGTNIGSLTLNLTGTTKTITAGTGLLLMPNIAVATTGIYDLASNIEMTTSRIFTNNGTLNTAGFAISGAGAFTNAADAVLGVAHAAGGINSAVTLTGTKIWTNTSIISYNAAGNQTISNHPDAFLRTAGSGTKTLGVGITMNGTTTSTRIAMLVGTGTTFDDGGFIVATANGTSTSGTEIMIDIRGGFTSQAGGGFNFLSNTFGAGIRFVDATTIGDVTLNYSSSTSVFGLMNSNSPGVTGGTGTLTMRSLTTANTGGGSLLLNAGGLSTTNLIVSGNVTLSPTTTSNTGGGFRGTTATTGTVMVRGNISTTSVASTIPIIDATGTNTLELNGAGAQSITTSSTATNILTGATLKLNNNNTTTIVNATVVGTISSASGGTNSLSFTGVNTMGTINMDATNKTLASLTINRTGGVTAFLGTNGLNITNSLNVISGTFNLNSQSLILKGLATSYPNTAIVSNITGTLSGATNVTTERYIPAGKRAYRQLASGVTTTNFISNNWQLGMHITGNVGTAGTQDGTTGFDNTQTGNKNMFTYTPGASNFTGISNTNATNLNAKTGYRVFVMGDRTANLTVLNNTGTGTPNIASTATTIQATGTLLTGPQSFTSGASELAAVANDYALIANPYWSPVDWDALTKSNINTTYWIWDQSIGNRGAYTSWTTGTGSSGGGAITKDIQPGQAIFVQTTANGAAQIDFAEANKTSTFTSTFRPVGQSPSKLVLNLIGAYGTNPVIVKDASTIAFRDDFSTAILGTEDAQKFTNSDENIAIINTNIALGLEARPTVATTDIIPIRLWKLFDNNTYSIKLNAQDFDAGIQAYLRDKKTNTQTAISMSGETTYPFTFTSTDSSSFYNRFEIVFSNTTALPANFTNIKAYRKNTGIQVEWDIAAETAIKNYEVQRSENADGFTTVASVTATANNGKAVNYDWFDANPFKTNNYYRIKVVSANGEVKYSSIVKVGNSKETEKVSVYPNPLEGNVVTLQLGGIADGKYEIQLFSSIGQQMMSSSITKQGAVQTQTLSLPKNMSAGVYRLSIRAEDGTIYNRNIIKL